VPSYLAGPENDPIIILWALLPLLQLFSPNADCHRAQVLIHPEVVLVLWGLMTGKRGRYEVRFKKDR